MDEITFDTKESIARIKLAVQEPIIRSRVPGLSCVADVSTTSKEYVGPISRVTGERVTVALLQGSVTIYEGLWITDFPFLFHSLQKKDYISPEVSARDPLTKLLQLSVFTPEDLALLSRSRIPEVRVAAAANLMDRALLAKLVAGDRAYGVRSAAARRINDLEAPEKAAARLTAVAQLTDQAALARVATEDKDSTVRAAAVNRLVDQAALARVALEDRDSAVRGAAVDRLANQATLARVAIEDKELSVKRAAFEKLTDQGALAQVAIEGKDSRFYKSAIERLADPALLAKVATRPGDAKWDFYSDARKLAVEKITDQAVLAKVATEDMNSDVRDAAVKKITDEAVLIKVAINDKSWLVSLGVLDRLDKAALARVAAEATDSRVRYAAAKRSGQ